MPSLPLLCRLHHLWDLKEGYPTLRRCLRCDRLEQLHLYSSGHPCWEDITLLPKRRVQVHATL